jgi:hypothetical protein
MKDPERVVVTLCAITAAIMITFIAFDVLHIRYALESIAHDLHRY